MGAVAECCTKRDADEPRIHHHHEKGDRPSGHACHTVLDRVGGLTLLPNNVGKFPSDKYKIGKELGSGSFGSVRLVTPKGGKTELAMKSIAKGRITNISVFVNEVEIQASAEHPNIGRLYETFEDSQYIYLVLEMCQGGELFDQVVKLGSFKEQDAAAVLRQATRGVAYLHAQDIAHRDLKPENFLLVDKTTSFCKLSDNTLKIIDFGVAKRFKRDDDGHTIPMKTKVGSSYYVSPQLVQGKYTEKSDVWALGIILYILMSGLPPFSGNNDAQIIAKISNPDKKPCTSGNAFKKVSEAAKQLIGNLCDRDEKSRPTAQAALTDKWMSQSSAADVPHTPLDSTLSGRLQRFGRFNRFKQTALHLIVHRLEDTKVKRLRQKFTDIDKNGDGSLSLGELSESCTELGIEEVRAKAIFEEVDTDNSGAIGYEEFLTALVGSEHYGDREVCEAAFRIFDRNGDGKISLDELKVMLATPCAGGTSAKFLHAMPEEEVEDIFNQADTSKDGSISFDEFMAVLRQGDDK